MTKINADTPPSPEMPPIPEVNLSSNVFSDIGLLLKFIIKFARIAGPYWNAKEKWKIRGWTAILIALTITQVLMPVWQNQWNADFFNALEKKAWAEFLKQIGILGAIMLSNMVITSSHLWFKRKLQVGWRAWFTDNLINNWMAAGHQHQLTYIPGEHDNPDGRIAEDLRNAVEVAIELIHSLFYCLLLLIGFTQILWSLSGLIEINLLAKTLIIPGHLVFIAIVYSIIFSSLALWLAQPLVIVSKRRQDAEAKFRFELGRARDNAETIALLRGEANERRRFGSLFRGVAGMWHLQSWAIARVMLFNTGYSAISGAFPLLVAAPRYISGTINLGALMQTSQAFQQVSQALSWPIDNAARVAEWRSSAERILALYDALNNLNQNNNDAKNRISLIRNNCTTLSFHNLYITMPDGRIILNCFNAEIQQGERILISGDSDAAAKLLKVVGGLWLWGHGEVNLPCDAVIFFLPQQPYVPKGNFRAIISYPTASHGIEDTLLIAALERVGLGGLAQRLDEGGAWEQMLTLGELQRLGFARALLHKPQWIFIDEATDALSSSEAALMMNLLQHELPEATILTISANPSLAAYHHRHLLINNSSSFGK